MGNGQHGSIPNDDGAHRNLAGRRPLPGRREGAIESISRHSAGVLDMMSNRTMPAY